MAVNANLSGQLSSLIQNGLVQTAQGGLPRVRRIELTDALAYYSAVTLGKGGYFFPLGRISPTHH